MKRAPEDLPAAVAAFLRGIERRALVLLWLQGSDLERAGGALAAALRAFPGRAVDMPMADWPIRFWKLLLASPPDPGFRGWPPSVAFLAPLALPVRRALLLRQVAGLDEDAAALVLGTSAQAYRQSLADACPRDAAGVPDPEGWRRQAEAIQQAGRDLDARPLQRARESALPVRATRAAVETRPDDPRPPGRRPDARPEPGRGRRWIIAGAAVGLAAVVAVGGLLWPLPQRAGGSTGGDAPAQEADDLRVHDNDPVVVEPLPDAAPPARPPDWPAPLAEPVRDPLVAHLALLSWYAAGMPASRIEREGEAAAVPLPASDEDAVAYPGAAALDAWHQLDPAEQARVRAASAAVQAQSAADRAELHARFAALDAMERAGWLLGPALGADYVALQPLLGFVGEDERAPLLALLRGLTPPQRTWLAELSARTPAAEREQLRRELLAVPPAARGAWLEQRARR